MHLFYAERHVFNAVLHIDVPAAQAAARRKDGRLATWRSQPRLDGFVTLSTGAGHTGPTVRDQRIFPLPICGRRRVPGVARARAP